MFGAQHVSICNRMIKTIHIKPSRPKVDDKGKMHRIYVIIVILFNSRIVDKISPYYNSKSIIIVVNNKNQ